MSVSYFEIPLTPNAQRFFITLANVLYQMQLIYRDNVEGGWVLDIYTAGGDALVQGIPLVTGVDLLGPYPDKNFGGRLLVTTDGNPTAPPTFSNLGREGKLYFEVRS